MEKRKNAATLSNALTHKLPLVKKRVGQQTQNLGNTHSEAQMLLQLSEERAKWLSHAD